MSDRIEKAKYYKVNFPFGDRGVSPIEDDDELEVWLNDYSLEEGDVLIEAKRLLVVKTDRKNRVEEFVVCKED